MSIYGCRLMCTIPQLESYFIDRERHLSSSSKQGSFHSKRDITTEKEPLRSGVSCLAWGPEGYHLLVACRSPNSSSTHSENGTNSSKFTPTSADMSGKFIQFSFMKSCLTTNPNMV